MTGLTRPILRGYVDTRVHHCGYPELRQRPDLANAIPVGKELGVPVVFWSRKVVLDTFHRGETVRALLASRGWRSERRGGTFRVWKDLRRRH